MKFKEIKRTSTLTWSPHQNQTFIATGTVAGALDASFSNTSELEIFKLDLSDKSPVVDEWKPEAVVSSEARFNRLAWGGITEDKPHGVLAGGLESGELFLWNASDLIEGSKDSEQALLLRNSSHSGSVSGLEFNPFQSNLLASAAGNGEIFIWDLSNPTKPYSPGPRSQRLDDITSLSWNNQVQHILATSSTTGYTVVWDLKNRREVMHLAYPGMSMPNMGGFGGGRRGITAVAWNPDNATQLVTASEDDSNPIIMMWDLRNAHAPEKILSGHTKGILSLSWCRMDSDLLLSSGKDCRTLCWNPRVGEVVGELPQSSNWTFDVQWCPRNPNLLSTASFDGEINIFSLQSAASEASSLNTALETEQATDPFTAQNTPAPVSPSFTLKQAPKWLRPPVGATFAFGGKLVLFRNNHGSQNPTPQRVTIATAITEPEIVQRSKELENALESESIQEFCDKRSQTKSPTEQEDWKILKILFESDARDRLVKHLGFEKAELVSQIAEKFGKLDFTDKVSDETPEAIETPEEKAPDNDDVENDKAAAVSEEDRSGDNETISELFSASCDDDSAARDDFFKDQTEPFLQSVDSDSLDIPKKKSSLRSPFKINPEENTEVDKLITRAITLGDFESAVSICLNEDRLSDALILAVCGGPELLSRTQEAYFARMSKATPYIRVLQSVITGDLNDVVENADLSEWNEILAILCTYSRAEEFASLCEKLGQRIEAKWFKVSKEKDTGETLRELRQHAVLCYLAAGNIEKVVDIWIAQFKEVESSTIETLQNKEGDSTVSRYSCHATLLQDFIEKISVFKKAVEKTDSSTDTAKPDSDGNQEEILSTKSLSSLYEKYLEYAELMISQGQLDTAVKYLNSTPDNEVNAAAGPSDFYTVLRERLYNSGVDVTGMTAPQFPFEPVFMGGEGEYPQYTDPQTTEPEQAPIASTNIAANTVPAATPTVPGPQVPSVDLGFQSSQQSHQQMYNQNASYGNQFNYQSQTQPSYQPGYTAQPVQSTMSTSTPYDNYGNPASYNSGSYGGYQQQPLQQPFVPGYNAPSTYNSAYSTQPPQTARGPPPSQQRNITAWNDPPLETLSTTSKRSQTPKVNPITSPFPNSAPGASSPNQPASSPPMGGRTLPPPPMSLQSSAAYSSQTPEPQTQQYMSNISARNQQQASNIYVAPQYNTANVPNPSVSSSAVPGYGGGFNSMNNTQGRPYQPALPNTATSIVPNTSSVAQQTASSASYIPPQSSVSSAPQAPPKPKYPPGDRTKIPAAHKPIFTMLNSELQRIKQSAPPNQKKKVDDIEKRLNNLFDALNYEQLNSDVIDQMLALTQALEMRDFNTAHKIHLDLVTTKFDTVGPWMVGVKRLIEMVREGCGM